MTIEISEFNGHRVITAHDVAKVHVIDSETGDVYEYAYLAGRMSLFNLSQQEPVGDKPMTYIEFLALFIKLEPVHDVQKEALNFSFFAKKTKFVSGNYTVENALNNKVFYGIIQPSEEVTDAKEYVLSLLEDGTFYNKHLQNSFNKYTNYGRRDWETIYNFYFYPTEEEYLESTQESMLKSAKYDGIEVYNYL